MNDIHGIIVVDKPAGWTSHDVVKKTKHVLRAAKVGHTGTLDPIATGVLILLIGRATKLARLFEHDRKRYLAEITFGRSTNTYDSTGKTIDSGDPDRIDTGDLLKAIDELTGEIEQIPPMFSAVKVGGKKLYSLARKGVTIERKPRIVNIEKVKADISNYPSITLDILCSKGTYIRSIAHQLGKTMGCPAHLSALRRTESGSFTLDDAVDFISVVESGNAEEFERAIIRPEELKATE